MITMETLKGSKWQEVAKKKKKKEAVEPILTRTGKSMGGNTAHGRIP